MVNEKSGDGGCGERQRFTVELRPEETTIVSWKNLIKDATRVSGSNPASVPVPPVNIAVHTLESRKDLGQLPENELQDAPAPHRFNAVIEKIERLYMGKNSSDEEDLDDTPDDDQYDTEDSFIDDAELDEYFQVDNSTIKHDGFYVNRGQLERIHKPTPLPIQQPKKRRRKDMPNTIAENGDVHLPRKHVKMGNMTAENLAPLAMKKTSDTSLGLVKRKHLKAVNHENQQISSKTPAETKATKILSKPLKVYGDASQDDGKDNEKQRRGATQSHNIGNKLKDTTGSSDTSHHKYVDRNFSSQPKSQSETLLNSGEEIHLSVRPRENIGLHGQPANSLFGGKHSMQKASYTPAKDGSNVRHKGSILENAFRELEKTVAESKTSSMDVPDADTSSQAVKRRLPLQVKQKLAKVAKLAASHGTPFTELHNRLMNILGQFMQLRTLKRHLRAMINMGLSAKQEKDDRCQQIKKEVTEMIQMWVASKELEQQPGASDDFQDFVAEEKGVSNRRKFSMDNALGDKICELHDLYADGFDEDAGSLIKRMYAELAQLWPNGSMDNNGIKRAIYRARERKKALHSQHIDQEKFRRKKLLVPKIEVTAHVEAGQPQHMREKLAAYSRSHDVSVPNREVSNTAAPARLPSSSNKSLSLDKVKTKKLKVNATNFLDDSRPARATLPKEKIKRKSGKLNEAHFRSENRFSQQGAEKHKSHKQPSSLSQTLNC